MNFPVTISFHNMAPNPSETIRENVYHHAEKLQQYYAHIIACRVVIEDPHRHHYKGNLFKVNIELTFPNATLIANRASVENHAHEDVYVAIRDAFDAITGQLKTYRSKQRGKIKHHHAALHGHVDEIAPLADYGYIKTPDGRHIRFNSNSVIGYDFSKLNIGDRVRFVELESDQGLVATTVYLEKTI